MGQSVTREVASAASVSVRSIGRLEALDVLSAPAFIEATARWPQRRIVAVEGFRALPGGTYQPAMDWILDLSGMSDPTACRQAAGAFVDDAPHDLLFVFDIEQLVDPET